MDNTVQRGELQENWKKRAFLGPLPNNFLRIESENAQQQQEAADQQAALALQQLQMQNLPAIQSTRMGRLNVTVVQAKLVKNYGMTRMDPYVRLRVGHAIYETHTDPNGGKNPHWNKVIRCPLPTGVTQVYVEIYDECSFTMDELIAWVHIDIPLQVVQRGETHEDWYTLSGKQGDDREGMINLVFSFATKDYGHMSVPPMMMVPSATMFGMPGYGPVNVYTAPPPVVPVQPVTPNNMPNAEAELQQIAEMFPIMDKEVINSVYYANQGKKDVTINSLLQMCE